MANYAITSINFGNDNQVMTLPYGVCNTAAGTAAKAVSAGDFSLETGATVVVKFTNTNSASNPTLNVSNTGDKAIYYKGATITASYLKANYSYNFVYNGAQWDLMGEINTDTQVAMSPNTSTKYYVCGTTSSSASTGTQIFDTGVYVDTTAGKFVATSVYGAVWNDYAEYREGTEDFEPGRVICENGDDTLSLATERLQPGANIVSDTFGFAIGETEKAKTPIAVSGRVLVYPYEDRNSYKPGDAVCAAPGGTVSKMTREEIREYPERILGTVSAIPTYEVWGEGKAKVNGRIWIKVR